MPRKHPKPAPSARGAKRAVGPRRDPLRDAEFEARRRDTCARKARYGSQAEARAHALMHNPGPVSARVGTYRCDVCDGWHFTRG